MDIETFLSNRKKWEEKYFNKEIVNLKRFLSEEDLKILKKLKIEVMDKIYTEYEFEILTMDLYAYYKYDGMSKEELENLKNLYVTGVNRNRYNNLLNKIESINRIYKF